MSHLAVKSFLIKQYADDDVMWNITIFQCPSIFYSIVRIFIINKKDWIYFWKPNTFLCFSNNNMEIFEIYSTPAQITPVNQRINIGRWGSGRGVGGVTVNGRLAKNATCECSRCCVHMFCSHCCHVWFMILWALIFHINHCRRHYNDHWFTNADVWTVCFIFFIFLIIALRLNGTGFF